jgi:hypothetical protein
MLKDDKPVGRDLKQAVGDYLKWMAGQGYSPSTTETYRQTLKRFVLFIRQRGLLWNEVFTFDTLKSFQRATGITWASGIRGLSCHLFKHGKIPQPIARRKAPVELPDIYEQYLLPIISKASRLLTKKSWP